MRLKVVSPLGLEQVCAAEIAALGLRSVEVHSGGISCEGSPADLLRLNLALRTANRVLLSLASGSSDALEALCASSDLTPFFAPGATYRLELRGGGGAGLRLASAAERGITKQLPGLRRVEEEEGGQRLIVEVKKGKVQLLLDSSGLPLHRRGYREETGPAPLQENVAAGILALAGYSGEQALVDPMCGSGTFLIEGALIALGLAPGLQRSFACEAWPLLAASEQAAIRKELSQRKEAIPPLLGSDLKAGSLGVARRNAARAGVREHLEFLRREVAEAAPPQGAGPGVVVANPPYGRRLGERRELGALYRSLGTSLRSRFAGWKAAILIADPALAEPLALPQPELHPLHSGGLRLHLLLSQL